MPVDIGTVLEVLREQNVDNNVITAVSKELQKVIADEKAQKNVAGTPKQKYQYTIVVNSPTNDINNLQGWVVKMPESDDPNTVLDKVQSAALKQSEMTSKGRKFPLRNLFAAFSGIKPKYTKEYNFKIVNKEPCRVINTDGEFKK